MKKIIETDEKGGLEALLGEKVLLMCAAYFYTGKLVAVNSSFVQLEDPAIVYETGAWSAKEYSNSERLHTKTFYVQIAAIEAYGVSK